jgi:glycosyltransferase involved in cell wall biosynthesis
LELPLLHILTFPTRFYPAISGGEFYIQRLCEAFQKKKHQVHLFSTNAIDFGALSGSGKLLSCQHKAYAGYHNLSVFRWEIQENNLLLTEIHERFLDKIEKSLSFSRSDLSFLFQNGPVLPQLEQWFLFPEISLRGIGSFPKFCENPPNIIHTSYLPYSNLIYALYLAKVLKIPAVITPFLHLENERYANDAIYHLLEKFDGILACTEYEKAQMEIHGLQSKSIWVLPMGVDAKKFQIDHRFRFFKQFPFSGPMILFCGYKNFEKGAIDLLHTIPLLAPHYLELNYLFIGPPTSAYDYELNRIRKQFPSFRIFNLTPENLSGIYDPIKIGAFQAADIFSMPSRSEAYGIAYLEAWACKKPVIAADIPAMHEVIAENLSGLLVPFNNPTALADALNKLLQDPLTRIKMGEYGYQMVISQNRWEAIAEHTLEIYRYLIEKSTTVAH